MNLKTLLLTKNDCYIKNKKMATKPKGVMVHSTGAPNATLKRYINPDDKFLGHNPNNNHWNMKGVQTCVHAFIGKLDDGSIATYQTLPWNVCGWHAGGAANNDYISFEICEDGDPEKNTGYDKEYFEKVYKEAVEFTAMLCKIYDIKPQRDSLICHCEGFELGIASNHTDVEHWFKKFGKNMDMFRTEVSKKMEGMDSYPVLKQGNSGEAVKTMQSKLNAFGYNLKVDGSFGPGSFNALTDFQTKNGLDADGVCGPATWVALHKSTTSPTPPAKTPQEITIENAVKDGVITTDADYWLNVLYGKTTVSKENLKVLMDKYHDAVKK